MIREQQEERQEQYQQEWQQQQQEWQQYQQQQVPVYAATFQDAVGHFAGNRGRRGG